MTPKEKAKELVEKMYVVHSHSASDISYYFSKQCALIAVDEVISVPYLLKYESWFYKEVKQEIEKL